MLRTALETLVDDSLTGRRLLSHPFYRRWEAGDLSRSELAAYAGQYRHFERALPEILERIVGGIHEPGARALVQANLDDERGMPESHLALFDEFVAAVGGRTDEEASPATKELVALYRRLADSDSKDALAAVAAYEVQSAEIAASKAHGLRVHYGLTGIQTRFWDIHSAVDESHARWTLDALSALADNATEVRLTARLAAETWWSFLDEREEAAKAA